MSIHNDLVARAGRWLRNTERCSLVLMEPAYGYPSEIPDALGVKRGRSIVVECKASRSDFFADANKGSRRIVSMTGASERLGDVCWYLVPHGMVSPEEVPEDWGLLSLRRDRVLRTKEARPVERSARAVRKEVQILASFGRACQLTRRGAFEYERPRFGEANLSGGAA